MLYELALEIAAAAHNGQVRKDGEPYIRHCVRVADGLDYDYFKAYPVIHDFYRAVAVLHDVIEDTNVTLSDIKSGLGLSNTSNGHILDLTLLVLTRNKSDSYLDYILKIKRFGLATAIKLCDLADNLRNASPGNLKEKYIMAVYILKEC